MATDSRVTELRQKYNFGDESIKNKIRDNWEGYMFILPIVVAFLLMYFFPLIRGFQLSLFEVNVGGLNRFIGVENYVWMVNNDLFVQALIWTLIFAFSTLILQMAIGLLAALLLNEYMTGHREWLSALVMSPYFAAAVAGGIIMKWFLNPNFGGIAYLFVNVGLEPINFLSKKYLVHLSLIIAQAWHDFAYAGIIYLAALQSVPAEQYEAAALDGASRLRRFWDVARPYLVTPTIIILATRTAWNLAEFAQPFEMTGGGPGNMTMLLSILTYNVAYVHGSLGRAYAIGLVMLIISVIAAVTYIVVVQREEELYV